MVLPQRTSLYSSTNEAFHKEDLDENSFNLYKNEGPFFKNAFYLVIPIAIYYCILGPILLSEILDNIPSISQKVSNEKGEVDRFRMTMLRCFIMLIIVLIAISTDNVVLILNIFGSICSPIGSFLVPVDFHHQVYLYYTYCWREFVEVSWVRKTHDVIYLLVTTSVMVMGIWSVYKSVLEGDA